MLSVPMIVSTSCCNLVTSCLDQKIKIIDEVKKRKKLSWREIAEEFKIGKTQTANVAADEARFREEYEHFRGKSYKQIQRGNQQYTLLVI